MKTGAFISWSGELSRKLAEAIRDWLPNVLQAVKPYFTPKDLEKGVKWDSEISKGLDESQIGLLCLTHNNMEEPWILFEAGALSTKIGTAKVCPILFGFEPEELKGPLATFQITRFTEDDFKKLISTINNSSEDIKLEQKILDKVFEKWWPELNEKINAIMSSHIAEPKKDPRTVRDILIEILELTRMLAKPQKLFDVGHITARGFATPFALDPERVSDIGASLGELSKRFYAEAGKTIEAIKSTVGQYYSALPAEEQVSKPPKPDNKE